MNLADIRWIKCLSTVEQRGDATTPANPVEESETLPPGLLTGVS